MEIIEIILLVLIVLAAAILTVAVLFQKNKTPGLSGAISGTSSDTYYGKGKTQSREKMLNRLTIVLAIFFAVVVLAFCIINPFASKIDAGDKDYYYGLETTTESEDTTEAVTTTEADVADDTTEAADAGDETPEA